MGFIRNAELPAHVRKDREAFTFEEARRAEDAARETTKQKVEAQLEEMMRQTNMVRLPCGSIVPVEQAAVIQAREAAASASWQKMSYAAKNPAFDEDSPVWEDRISDEEKRGLKPALFQETSFQ